MQENRPLEAHLRMAFRLCSHPSRRVVNVRDMNFRSEGVGLFHFREIILQSCVHATISEETSVCNVKSCRMKVSSCVFERVRGARPPQARKRETVIQDESVGGHEAKSFCCLSSAGFVFCQAAGQDEHDTPAETGDVHRSSSQNHISSTSRHRAHLRSSCTVCAIFAERALRPHISSSCREQPKHHHWNKVCIETRTLRTQGTPCRAVAPTYRSKGCELLPKRSEANTTTSFEST